MQYVDALYQWFVRMCRRQSDHRDQSACVSTKFINYGLFRLWIVCYTIKILGLGLAGSERAPMCSLFSCISLLSESFFTYSFVLIDVHLDTIGSLFSIGNANDTPVIFAIQVFFVGQ